MIHEEIHEIKPNKLIITTYVFLLLLFEVDGGIVVFFILVSLKSLLKS